MSELTPFLRQLRYTPVQEIFDNLTDTQKVELLALLEEINVLGAGGAILKIETEDD